MSKPVESNSKPSSRSSRTARAAVAAAVADPIGTWIHDMLRDLRGDAPLLALGCEEASFAAQLAEYGSETVVLDVSGRELAQLARRFPEITFLQHQPSAAVPFEAGSFAAVCCCELLDRALDPAATLRSVHRVLMPRGRLLVTVPDCGAMRKVLAALFGQEKTADSQPRIHQFTRRTLERAVKEAGFSAIRIRSVSVPATVARRRPARRLLLSAIKGATVGASVTPSRRVSSAPSPGLVLAGRASGV